MFVKIFFCFALSNLLYWQASAQQLKAEEKIDPAFRSAILNQKAKAAGKLLIEGVRQLKTTVGFASGDRLPKERYECIVYTKDATQLRSRGIVIHSELPGFVTAWVTLDQVIDIASLESVQYIKAPVINQLYNDIAVATSGASLLHQGRLNNTEYKGKNVIVGVIDSGIDWDHLDFRNPDDTTKSRILNIWDQTITANTATGESSPPGFSYGVHYTQAQINNEIDGTRANFVREKDNIGHGTHVTGVAAGNGSALPSRKYAGLAPEADIVFVKTNFRNTSIIDAITYLKNLATNAGKPLVINLSLGNHASSHDGTDPVEIAIDHFSSSDSGRAVVVSAGNANGSNIHNRLSLSPNATNSVSFTVPSDTTSTYIFSYGVCANNNSSISATLTLPGAGGTVSVTPGNPVTTYVLSNNFQVELQDYIDPSSGLRFVVASLVRNGTNKANPTGNYKLSLTNNTSNTLTLDGWLFGTKSISDEYANTGLVNGNSNYLIATPGNAASAITVGSFLSNPSWHSAGNSRNYSYTTARQDDISSFSSHGPRRDGVLKPEITAAGQALISCLSSDVSTSLTNLSVEGLYQVGAGTSMSSSVVAGAIALLFQANPSATSSQVKNLLTSTATKNSLEASVTPDSIWGYG